MPQIGAVPVSLRGDGMWRGLTTMSKAAPFQFLELENCYVSRDGQELRMFPGWKCVIDPSSAGRTLGAFPTFNTNGYIRSHFMARRGFLTGFPYKTEGPPTQVQYVWTKPTTLHFAEQLNRRWVFCGESDLVREEIFNSTSTGTVYVTSYDDSGGTKIDLTLNANPLITALLFNSLQTGDRIIIEGAAGVSAALLNNLGHIVDSFPAANVVRINTNPGGAIAAQPGQTASINRVTSNGLPGGPGNAISDDKDSLTIWTCLEQGIDSGAAFTTVHPAHVANRQRDFGDNAGVLKQGNDFIGTINGGRSRRRQKSIPYRLVPHVAGNRIVVAAPGYGCVFQLPCIIPPNFDEFSSQYGINAVGNDIYDMPRSLGVPKAVMWEDPDKTGSSVQLVATFGPATNLHWGGSDASVSPRNGTYKFAVAYRDEATGEVGLRSEPVTIRTANYAPFVTMRLVIYFPGYLMHESLALTVILYRTQKDGTEFFFDSVVDLKALTSAGTQNVASSKYGLTPEGAGTEYFFHALLYPSYSTDAVLQSRLGFVPSTVEQMPMGCKASRTIRGWTMFGGALGNAGSRKELMKGSLSLFFDGHNGTIPYLDALNFYPDRIGSAFVNNWVSPIAASFEGSETDFGCAAKNIPPAYSGQVVVSKTLLPYPRKAIVLNKLENTDIGWYGVFPNLIAGRIPDVRYSFLDTPVLPSIGLFNLETRRQDAYILLPRSRLQISEPDNPGVTPATSTTILANEFDHDIEGIGDANGQAIICSRERTYTIAFSQSPVGIPPDIVGDKFGCISANSMVSFDGGCAWMSHRGPVLMGNDFIGAPLEKLFTGESRRYLTQNDGMMHHSWASHDAERGLLYFGVYAGRAGTNGPNALTVNYRGTDYTWDSAGSVLEGGVLVADQIRSRFPCDEILVYSYVPGVWSVWRPPLNFGIKWMPRGVDGKGNSRVFFLDSENRLNVLDDLYGNGDKECFQQIVVDTGTLATLTITPTGVRTWIGLEVLVYSTPTATAKAQLRGRATVVSQTSTTITLSSAIAVTAGDTIIVGARAMTVHTTFFNLKAEATTRLASIGLRYSLASRHSEGLTSTKQHAFVTASARTEQDLEGIPATSTKPFTSDSPANYRNLGIDLPDDAVHDVPLAQGGSSGANQQVRLTIVGGAQVKLQNIFAEVQ
jgi:hypothetical protein